jgi:16S rRNA (uracil1498-N3)-methyltransferase
MGRFFVDKDAVKEKTIEVTNREDILHINKVLRLGIGDRLEISDSNEFEYTTQIEYISPSSMVTRILDKQKFSREPELQITLFQGLPKQGKMETIIQKAVEIGVHTIIPVFTERTVVTEKDGFQNKLDRWRKISAEAVKQCKRGIVPEILKQMNFRDLSMVLSSYDLILIPYENEETHSIKDALRSIKVKPKTVAIIVGPEGGFSSKEIDVVEGQGGIPVTLGKTILRTETAGLVAAAMVMYELEL